MYILTFSWPTAMVMAAAEVKPLITGTGMKSTKTCYHDALLMQLEMLIIIPLNPIVHF